MRTKFGIGEDILQAIHRVNLRQLQLLLARVMFGW